MATAAANSGNLGRPECDRNLQMHDVNLAWALADAINDCLGRTERVGIYVALGSGDTHAAIRRLTSAALCKRVELATEVSDAVLDWLHAQDGWSADFAMWMALSSTGFTSPRTSSRSKNVVVRGRYRRCAPTK
jgi:hypothetical protein